MLVAFLIHKNREVSKTQNTTEKLKKRKGKMNREVLKTQRSYLWEQQKKKISKQK